MDNVYGNATGKTKQVFNSTKDNDDNDDDDYENFNPCDKAPVVPSRKTRRTKNALKNDLPLKCMDKPAKQHPSVWTTPQKETFPKETSKFQSPHIGLDFSSGAVNSAFSDIAEVKMASVLGNTTFPDLEVISNVNKPRFRRPRRCTLVFLTMLIVIIFIAFAVFTGFIFFRYIAFSRKVADVEQTVTNTLIHSVSDFKKNDMEKQISLMTKVADLNSTIVKLQDLLKANEKHINKTLEKICTTCPVGWYTIGSACYYVSGQEISWDLAREECYKMSSILVMIKDKTESESLKKLFSPGKKYWIGLRRDAKEVHVWKWLDGTQVTFTNWDVNEPNYHSSREHCGETKSGPWNDRNCIDNLFYICKKIKKC
ncbi:C-type lectin domain family 4 member G-like [Dendrobates tinctorius]|uniref:C-type lectin domain family 4 member G-like n=1 Tax=Dendrobates tinctorius TaxID=92724 RepID=UPI003CCA6485